ncbi:MAG: isoaspartyl peptidase/L-asparaginase [Bacteroidia bacterium]
MNPYGLAIHGGAGTITRSLLTAEKETAYRKGLSDALTAGEDVLRKGGSAMDAVIAAVVSLEDCPLFNAGRGSVFTAEGTHEMDASLMRGDNLDAGAVAGVAGVKNPVLLAKAIMEKSDHVLLAGKGAEIFAREQGLVFEPEAYFHDEFRWNQLQDALREGRVQLDHTAPEDRKFGTVGAVARDKNGNLAAATSTGGMTNKKFNRIGDSPVIGAGTYANNATCAVSCTGHGEFFIRAVVAYDVSCLMEYKGLTLQQACEVVVMDKLVKIGGEGGLIAIDKNGNIELPFNSEGMYRGCVSEGNEKIISIYR